MLTAFIIRAILIALMMEAVSTFETSVNFRETICRNIRKDSHLHTEQFTLQQRVKLATRGPHPAGDHL
jgi:hypothetical protein